jgi:hypothetical protein
MVNTEDKSHTALPTHSRGSSEKPKVAAEAHIAQTRSISNLLARCSLTVVVLSIYTYFHGAGLATITIRARQAWLSGESSNCEDYVGSSLRLISAYTMVGIVAFVTAPLLTRIASRKGLGGDSRVKKGIGVVLSHVAFVACSFLLPWEYGCSLK